MQQLNCGQKIIVKSCFTLLLHFNTKSLNWFSSTSLQGQELTSVDFLAIPSKWHGYILGLDIKVTCKSLEHDVHCSSSNYNCKTITIMEILITTELNRAALWFVLKGNLLPTIRRISF